jgi:hypothetical protein
MTTQPNLFADPPQPTWTPPKGRHACTRDPAAGPGSCWFWWESCPRPEKRGCYVHWWRARQSEAPTHA